MVLDYAIVIVVTIGIILGIISGKYRLVKRYEPETSPTLELPDNSEEINDFIINETKERINQELQNMAADELKANVVSAISVVFAILVISQFMSIFSKINQEILWLPIVLITITIIVLFIGFLCGIKVLIPREKRFDLWLPRETNNSYASRNIGTKKEIQKDFKEELISNFETIDRARTIDGFFLTWGYSLLIGGSLISFITLIISQIFWING